jgi:hypothetical protein
MLDKKTIVETLGTAGVIASLIFVGVQVQQGAAATRSATVLQLKDAWVQLNLAQATSPELSEAWRTVHEDGWDTDYHARSLVTGFYRTLLHNWSNAYYQHRNGTLEEDQWLPHLREVQGVVGDPIFGRVWSGWNHVYDDPFRELVDHNRVGKLNQTRM